MLNYNRNVPVLHNLRVTLEMIKWEHSIFALPFALCGAMLAAGGLPSRHELVWIIVAMVAARSAAMAFNRWADAALMRPILGPARAHCRLAIFQRHLSRHS